MLSLLASSLLSSALVAGGLTDSLHPDPDIRFAVYGGVGSGISMGGQGEQRLSSRSPTYLTLAGTARLSQIDWLTFDGALVFEFEKRVGLGLLPRLRARLIYSPRYQIYAGMAMPIFVHSYSLWGVSSFVRAQVKLSPRVSLFAEPTVSAFIAGNDLVEGQGLMKMDLTVGVHIPL